ncbi:MAG: hypothetical protein ACK4ND_10985 [Cytophagaceae bacterium]
MKIKAIHLSIPKTFFISVLACLMSFIIGIYIGKTRGIPFVEKKTIWSIGIYTGPSPFDLTPPNNFENPVLTARDVKDVPAEFVADPFMVKENNTWYMFFEVLNKKTNQGDLGVALSKDGLNWTYKQIILDEPFHLSYPYVFKWGNDYYMIPESNQAFSIKLYKAINSPYKWTFVKNLIEGKNFSDNSIIFHNNKWWIFTSIKNDTLRLYYSSDLLGPWTEHPKSPIINGNPSIARAGGRVILFNNQIIRFAQDDYPYYGKQVRAFKITELSTQSYKEEEIGLILKPLGSGWNAKGMHHIDPHQLDNGKWIACVDGFKDSVVFGLKY